MKIHFKAPALVAPGFMAMAVSSWEGAGLIPHVTRACDGLMVSKDKKQSLTSNADQVTCKRCLRFTN